MRIFAFILTLITTAAFSQSGSLYSTFGQNGQTSIDVDDLDDLTLLLKDESGNTYFCGSTSENQVGIYPYDICIGKIDSNGELDMSFGIDGIFRADFPNHSISALKGAVINENGIFFIGNAVNLNVPDTNAFYVGKINLDGTLDTNFADAGYYSSSILGTYNTPGNILIDSEEKIVFCGSTTDDSNAYFEFPFIGRLYQNGTIDSTFGETGIVVWDHYQGALVNGMDVYSSQDRHGEGAYISELVEINNTYFLTGKYVNTFYSQLHLMSITKTGELNPNFVSQGPYPYQIDPGYNHLPHQIVFDTEKIYVAIETDGNFYNGKQLIQRIDTTGILETEFNLEHLGYDSRSMFLKKWNGEFYVGGYSKEESNNTPGHLSDQFLLVALDSNFNLMSGFGQDGVFESTLSWGDDEIGAEDFVIHDNFGVIGGYHNNVIGNNITDFVFMAVDLNENLQNNVHKESFLKIFPNPSRDYFIIESEKEIRNVKIYDLEGRLIKTYFPNAPLLQITNKSIAAGIYNIAVSTDEGTSFEKIIIQ